jgi:hypothetical protein
MPVRLRVLLGICAMSLVAVASAQTPTPPKSPSLSELDKMAVDILKDVHNRGAVLNNNGNADACYYMYEGAIRVVRPFLGHRPALQAMIDKGLEEVGKTEGSKIKAFRLHEVIEEIRAELKKELKKSPLPEPGPTPKSAPIAPMTKPAEPSVAAPTPKPVPMTNTPSINANEALVKGTIVLDGKPLGGAYLTIVTTDKPMPRVLSVKLKDDGTYTFDKPLPPGEYAMMVTHETVKVPERYQTTLTSGLRFSVRAGANNMDLKLVSK